MADSLSTLRDPHPNRYRVLGVVSLLGVFIAVAAWLWSSGAVSWLRAAQEPTVKPRPASHYRTAELMAAAPADLPGLVRQRYRLRPDRRLLLAVAEIQRLRTGVAPAPVKAELQDGRWRILSGSDEVGELSEFPAFEEATGLLASWAGRWPQAPADSGLPGSADVSGVERAVREVDAEALLKALSSLGGSPADAPRDEGKVRSIVSGLAWLSTMTVDLLDQADPLLAESWAWLALERSRDAGGEALAARALGYEAAAARASSRLAADDPIRLYVTGDEARLGAVCAGRPADRPCHFLHLALLAERDQVARFRSAIASSPFKGETSLVTVGLETRLSDFETATNLGHGLADEAMTPLLGQEGGSVEARTRDFEAAVDRLASGRGASPIDAAAIQAGYRAVFYSGLFREARFLVDQYASGPAARELAVEIKMPAPGTADELRRWIELRAAVVEGSRDPRPLAEFLESSRSIGAAPLVSLGLVIARQAMSTDPLRRRPMPALFARLDTRPAHRVMAARLAERNLNSPGAFETLARAAAEAAPHLSEELPALDARLREDTAGLRGIADDPAMPGYARSVALASLSKLGEADDAFVRARYEAIAEDPDEGTEPLLDFLEKRGDLRGALAAVESAIQRSNHQEGLLPAHLRTEKARLRLALGDPEGAFAALQPALVAYKEETLLQAATIELARHHPEKALVLAQGALEHYPRNASEASGLIARARWRLNDFSTAAKELAASRNGIVGAWNRYLPEAFAESFAAAPESSARQAFSELEAAGIAPHVLADAAVALGRKRGLAIAQPLLEGLHDPAPEWNDYIRLATYDLILEKSGRDAALAWVRTAMRDRPSGFALMLFEMRRYDLLLGLYPEGEESPKPNLVRMLKAASLLHLRETCGPRWDGVVAEIAKDPGEDFFVRAARYLVGKIGTGEFLRVPPKGEAGSLASVGWAMGVKAASERRFADADGWFQVALESGQQQQPPHAWSWSIESDWRKADRSLAVLEKKGEF